MTFWIAAAALTGLTCLALLSALGRKPAEAAKGHDRTFYEQQIAEIERQASLKLIGEAEAEAARTEAARRLLAATRDEGAGGQVPAGSRRLAAVAVLILTPTIALPIYLLRGNPDQPGMPLASREQPANDPRAGDILAAVRQIEAHLVKNPDDGRGHEVVGPVYLRLGRAADAVRAFQAALRLLGPTAERQANVGEALVHQADGVVTAEAKAAFAAAVAQEPKHARSRFFLAMAAQQDGDPAKAKALLAALRDDLPEGPLRAEIERQLVALGTTPAVGDKAGEAIASLAPADQQAAIRSMVEGLAQRLATGGGTADEWARLVRALTVLKETDRAGAILAEARQKFAGDPEALQRIEAAGRPMGATP